MSGNVIKKAIPVGKIVKFGIEIACEVATETTEWTRPSDMAAVHGPALREAIANSTKPLPPNTKKLISRYVSLKSKNLFGAFAKHHCSEGDHTSEGDPKDHITAVAYDGDDNRIATIHLDTPKKG